MTESKFAAALVRMFNSSGCSATRIESHGTGNGIPDMYVLGFGTDFWLELKHDPMLRSHKEHIKVEWRPGQQGWMYTYHLQHRRKRFCLTVIKACTGYYIVPMHMVYKEDTVYFPIWVEKLDIRMLWLLTYKPMCLPGFTYRDMLLTFMETWFPDVDYDPEVLWNRPSIDDPAEWTIFYGAIPRILEDINYGAIPRILEDINYGQRIHVTTNSRETESPGAVVQERSKPEGSRW